MKNINFFIFIGTMSLTYMSFGIDNALSLNGVQNSKGGEAAAFSVDVSKNVAVNKKIDAMNHEQKRQFYKEINDNQPYVPLLDVLDELDRGLLDDDLKIRLLALERFIKSYYMYGSKEPGRIFNKDTARKQIFINMLSDESLYIRLGAFRVLAENFNQQTDVVEQLTIVVQNEKYERLTMMRHLAQAIHTHPDLVSRVYIAEVKKGVGGEGLYRATAVESAYILSTRANPPEEIIESIITMFESTHFGSTLLLKTIDNYGAEMKPYIGRLKQLQVEVNERILYGRDKKGKGSSTFKKSSFEKVLHKIESYQSTVVGTTNKK